MKYATIDFETYSRADLQKQGVWKYAGDFTTGILCLGFKLWVDGKPNSTRVLSEQQIHARDPELMDLANDPTVIFSAHNASFEQAIWHFQMVPAGYPELPPEKWHDTMAVCGMKALPLGLDAAVSALELPVRKDMDGHRLMLAMCRPDRIGGWSQHNDLNLKRLYEYNVADVEAQDALYAVTKGLGPSERHTWVLDQRINQRGIKIDKEFVGACIDVLDQVRVPMTERFRELTGLCPTQREKVLNWVNDQGIPLGDMKKATLNAILDPDDEFGIEDFAEPLPHHVHEALTLRRSLASSSVSKLRRMLECASDFDGRVRYATQYHGARTGRDAGRLIQIQNYPRGEIGDRRGLTSDALADAILTRDLSTIRELWGPDIFTAVISSLRSCIVPEKGKVLVVGDLAQVEAKNLLSMAGQHDKAELMHSGFDAYNEFGSLMFRRPFDRKGADKVLGVIPKGAVLGAGYGLGPVGFRARFIPKSPMELSKLAIDTYRKDWAPCVPKFWYGLWEASCSAAWCDHAKTYSYEGIEFRKEGDFLTMRLPSGRKLWYHRPRKATTQDFEGNDRPSWTFMSYQGKKFRRHLAWHGMITADCIQGLSRDLIMTAMKKAEAAGLNTIFKVHDELVFEEVDRSDLVATVKQIMEDAEPWVLERRLRIKAEVESMKRYRK